MNKQKRIIFLVIVVSFIMLLASGCANNNVVNKELKTIEDCTGRMVDVPENPERVACFYATTAHMMVMLDEQERIVGCPRGVKSDVLVNMKYPEVKDTATPYQEGSINTEELLRIKADLVLLSASSASNQGEVEKLDKLGIPYAIIDYTNIEELHKAVKVVGEIFNKQEKAQAYLDFLDDTLELVEGRLASVDDQSWPQVYHSVNEAIRTDSSDSICCEIMELAHVDDIAVSKGTAAVGKNTYVTLEEIYKWNPEAIVANESSVTEYIMTDSKWQGLDAVKSEEVYTLPVGATRWCHPGSMEAHMGVLALATIFYPEEFDDFDIESYVKDYYSDYFGLELDDSTIKKILSGAGMRQSNSPVE